jgi:hypothetical protein
LSRSLPAIYRCCLKLLKMVTVILFLMMESE